MAQATAEWAALLRPYRLREEPRDGEVEELLGRQVANDRVTATDPALEVEERPRRVSIVVQRSVSDVLPASAGRDADVENLEGAVKARRDDESSAPLVLEHPRALKAVYSLQPRASGTPVPIGHEPRERSAEISGDRFLELRGVGHGSILDSR